MARRFLKVFTIATAFYYVNSRIISGISPSVLRDEMPSASLRLISRGLIAREPIYLSSGACTTPIKLSPFRLDKRDNLRDLYYGYEPQDNSFSTAPTMNGPAAVQTADTEDIDPTQWTPDDLGRGEEKLGQDALYSAVGTNRGNLVEEPSPSLELDNIQMAGKSQREIPSELKQCFPMPEGEDPLNIYVVHLIETVHPDHTEAWPHQSVLVSEVGIFNNIRHDIVYNDDPEYKGEEIYRYRRVEPYTFIAPGTTKFVVFRKFEMRGWIIPDPVQSKEYALSLFDKVVANVPRPKAGDREEGNCVSWTATVFKTLEISRLTQGVYRPFKLGCTDDDSNRL